MFVRRKPNKSGSFSVQVVRKQDGRYKVVKSFGSSADENQLRAYEKEASDFISTYGGQLTFNFEDKESEELRAKEFIGSITSLVPNGPHLILDGIYDGIGFGELDDDVLRDLVVSRICHPMSKLATVDYLKRYKGVSVDINELYRDMDRLDESVRQKVQRISVEHTRTILGGRIGIVFYDVTTLYFASATEDV